MDQSEEWQPNPGLLLQLCSITGADSGPLEPFEISPQCPVLRVPCSGRVNPQFILRAFQKGVDGVLVAGCHPGDCHYVSGNYFTRRRFLMMQRFLEYNGNRAGRFQARWFSGSEA